MSWIREQELLRLIAALWNELTPSRQAELLPELGDMQWAIPAPQEKRAPDDLLSETELAAALGMTVAAVRNWPRRYSNEIKLIDGKYRWGDVNFMLLKRRAAKEKKTA